MLSLLQASSWYVHISGAFWGLFHLTLKTCGNLATILPSSFRNHHEKLLIPSREKASWYHRPEVIHHVPSVAFEDIHGVKFLRPPVHEKTQGPEGNHLKCHKNIVKYCKIFHKILDLEDSSWASRIPFTQKDSCWQPPLHIAPSQTWHQKGDESRKPKKAVSSQLAFSHSPRSSHMQLCARLSFLRLCFSAKDGWLVPYQPVNQDWVWWNLPRSTPRYCPSFAMRIKANISAKLWDLTRPNPHGVFDPMIARWLQPDARYAHLWEDRHNHDAISKAWKLNLKGCSWERCDEKSTFFDLTDVWNPWKWLWNDY